MKSTLIVIVGWTVLAPSASFAADGVAEPLRYSGPDWSPYLVGALIGVLSMFTFYFSDKPLGASTAYARIAGLIGSVFAAKHTAKLKFYRDNKPVVDWEVMLLLGVIVGAFLAAWQGDEFTNEWLPGMWAARFGDGSLLLRLAATFGGGVLMAFGARLAGGCTSGHGISGTMQLSVGSWIAVICFFVGGIGTAMLMFRG
jgi:uncharacterized membrane protein YedE/YeeE